MKILIIGCSGTGKSTLAKELHHQLEFPLLHLDQIWHVHYDKQKFYQQLQNFMTDNPDFIIDGNYADSLPMRVVEADTIIWLQTSRIKAVWRVLLRSLKIRLKLYKRDDMAEAFQEKWDKEYWKFLKFVWNFQKENYPSLEKALADKKQNCKVYIIQTERDRKRLLENLY